MTAPELGLTRGGNFCRAVGCSEPIAKHLLMCGDHWRMVPPAIQNRVHSTDRMRRERKPGASQVWLAAAQEAIREVARRENRRPKKNALVGILDNKKDAGL